MANRSLSQERGALTQKRIYEHFGLMPGNARDRADRWLHAAGFPGFPSGGVVLGDARYLTSRVRRSMVRSDSRRGSR